ncbi:MULTISPECIES: hypothetical protein [Paraburkholderia]|uniref:Uncharacterized protein n=1 Tax=Paraburkholderia youngii TaxID=2782701 RepID=A0A7Y6K6V7_9BURK|nr:hypothetical protein [Paraburkholderia youngii]NUY05501.1 hypothetical protein [Paraburkholderia youngii]
MTPREAQNILYAAFVAAALIVQAQPYRDDVHAQRRFEQIVNRLLSEHVPRGMSVAEFIQHAG